MAVGSTRGKRRLARAVKPLFAQSGLTAGALATRAQTSRQTVSRLLTGENLPNWKTVLAILYELDVDKATIAGIKELHAVADASTSSISFATDLSAEYLRLRLDEVDAVLERTLNLTGLPGPLQTKSYAEFTARKAWRRVGEEWPEIAGDERNERTALLTRDENPLRLEAVIFEGALRMLDGLPRSDRDEQLDVLITAAEQGLADFYIRPFNRGPHSAYLLTLLSFPEDDEPDSAYLDSRFGLAIVDDVDAVNVLRDEWCDARDEALTPAESIAFLEEMRTGVTER